MNQYETREQWLVAATEALRPLIKSAGYTIPKVRVSCGFPVTGGTRRKNGGMTIGQCLMNCSADGHQAIFIHPVQDQPITDEGRGVLETLLHELLHACLPPDAGHKKPFARACKAVGLEGKPTQTVAGAKLIKTLREIADKLGTYPHASVEWTGKKQSTRLLKVVCTQCGCVVRMTAKWIDEVGTPICGCGAPMQEATGGEDTIALKTLEQMVIYETTDKRFEIKFIKDRLRGNLWYLVDFDYDGKLTLCESKQDCFDTIDAIETGMVVYDDAPVEDESDYEVDEFEMNHDWAFEVLMPEHHLPNWQEEDPDNPIEDMVDTYQRGTQVVQAPSWESRRDNYGAEDEPVEVVPSDRPEPKPETVAFFGADHLRA